MNATVLSQRVPEVLIATINAGGGHVATATAMAEAVAAAAGGKLTPRVAEVMPELGFTQLDRRHKESWRRLLGRPRLIRWSQRVLDAAPAASRAGQNLLLGRFARAAAERYQAERPALIVVNHGWLATAFTLARAHFGLDAPVVVFATEPFDASALWSTPQADAVLAPSTAAAQSLRRLGVPASALRVSGYPVAERFSRPPSQAVARASLRLAPGYTCLLSLGAEGVATGDVILLVERLALSGVRVLCMCGRNVDLRRALDRVSQRVGREAGASATEAVAPRVFGFVEDMETYLAAADVVVGKAGPASALEALAVGRPVIATAYAGLNELAVVRYLTASGWGELCRDGQAVLRAVAAWRDRATRPLPSRPDFAAMTAGIGTYLARAAAGEDGSSALAPGSFAAVDEAYLAAARPTGDA